MPNRKLLRTPSKLTPALLLFAGCGGVVEDAPPTHETNDPIINGTVPAAGAAQFGGWVRIDHAVGSSCSATLLRNDMVLTARHCTTTNGQTFGPADNTGTNYSLVMGAQTRNVTEVIRHPTLDVALLQLGQFMGWGTPLSNFEFGRGIYTGTNASLQSQTLQCFGYGNNALTSCTPPGGTGWATLRTANLTVASTTTQLLNFSPNGTGQIQWTGDSGGTCLSGIQATGVQSFCNCNQNPLSLSNCSLVGPEAYRQWATDTMNARSSHLVHAATSSNIVGNKTTINNSPINGNPNAFLYVTQNWNPNGQSGVYNNAHIGVWYDSSASRWKIFNENGAAMPVGADFNVWPRTGGANWKHVTSAATIPWWLPHVSLLDFGDAGLNSNPNAMLIVQQREVTNNRGVGVWFDTGSARWYVYNEDGSAMTVGASFNVTLVSNTWGGFIHTTATGNIGGNSSTLSNANINGQPNAQMVITHNFSLAGTGPGAFHNKALGVWFDSGAQRWKIFNQDGSAMPAGLVFNVMVRP